MAQVVETDMALDTGPLQRTGKSFLHIGYHLSCVA